MRHPGQPSLRILVTDAHELAALGAIRSLGRAGHHVTAACPWRFGRPAAAWSRGCARLRHSPDPWRSHPAFRHWLARQLASGEFDAVLPIGESAIAALAALRRAAPPGLLLLMPDDASLEFSLSKAAATRRALELGLPCPPTVFVEEGLPPAELERQLAALRFPVVVKTDNALTPGGACRKGCTVVAGDLPAALAAVRGLAPASARRIVQELVPGSGAGAFFLRQGGAIRLQFAHRRLHEVPYTGGMSALRESCHDQALLEAGRRLLEGLDYQGVAMVEFRRDGRDGSLRFLEINGRLWGSLALALHCGVDFPRAMIAAAQEKSTSPDRQKPALPAPDYADGLRCRNFYPGDCAWLNSILRARRTDGAAPPPWPRALGEFLALTLNPAVRHDHFWWSDPGPAVAQGLTLARRVAGRLRIKLMKPYADARARRREAEIRARHAALLAHGFTPPPRRILFLCYGNICRSPFAEVYWNALRARPGFERLPPAASAGFYPEDGRPAPAWIQDLAAAHGAVLAAHRSRRLTPEQAGQADIIFVMDHANERALLAQYPHLGNRVFYLGPFAEGGPAEIADPFMAEEDEAAACYRTLAAALEGLARALAAN